VALGGDLLLLPVEVDDGSDEVVSVLSGADADQ
jgi:hypothetical protein